MMFPTTDGHQWISITDVEGESWMFDMAFLASGFACIYGRGCRSIGAREDAVPHIGCCEHGAHFADTDDRSDTSGYVDRLNSGQWQNLSLADSLGGPFKATPDGGWATRVRSGVCIFSNSEDFPGGAGCALHIGAVEAGERPLDWKPDVCWQVPIRLEVFTDANGHDTMLVKAWDRRDWGEGGVDFGWWCVESESAYGHLLPLYLSMEDELRELVGPDVFKRFVSRAMELGPRLPDTPVSIS